MHDGKVLLARSRGQSVFQIPGGKVEAGDADDLAALRREIYEELGVALIPDTAVYLGLFSAAAAGKTGRIVSVKLYRAAISGTPKPCAEIEELAWVDPVNGDAIEMSDVVRFHILPFLGNKTASQ